MKDALPNETSAQFASAPVDSTFLGEDNFRHLAEALPEIVFTATPTGELDYFSSRWGQFGGLSQDDPEYLNWSPRLHPDDVDEVSQTWMAAVAAGQVYEHEFRLRSATDEYSWFYTRVIPVRDSRNKIVKWYGVTTDINERKEMELQLRKVSERKDEFIAMLGHELRNPLAAIKTSHAVLTRQEANEEQRAAAFKILGNQIDHLSRLVDDTLDVSRLSSGKLRLIKCPVELNQLVVECCEGYQERAAARELTLSAESFGCELWVNGDDVRLMQCLTNLLNNAVKFTHPGGSIRVKVTAESGTALVQVSDTGVGMSQEEISQIFNPFEQGRGASRLSTSGLGLGLAVVDKLVEMHGGSVSVNSEGKDQGSTFIVRFPIEEPPNYTEELEPLDELITTQRILILEDNESVALSLQMFFELEGHEVRVAMDGESALAMLEEDTPDILISDLTLPGHLSGWNVAEKVTRSYPKQHLPYLVALSGHAQTHYHKKSIEAGFDEHLAKPPTPKQLRNILLTGRRILADRRT